MTPAAGSPYALDIGFEVSLSALSYPATISSTAFLPANRTGKIVIAVPGGTYSRAYWHQDPSALAGYSFCEHLCRAGVTVVAVDNLGTGDSTRPADSDLVTPELMGDAIAQVATQVRARALSGALDERLGPMSSPELIGVGHSLGGLITVLQQSKWHSYDRVAVLGYTAVPSENSAPYADRLNAALEMLALQSPDTFRNGYLEVPRSSLKAFFYGDFVDRDVISADARTATVMPRIAGAAAMVYGSAADAAARIDVPVFLAFGEQDLSPDPRQEAAAYHSSDDITVFVLPGSAHCHNLAPTRFVLWNRLLNWIGEGSFDTSDTRPGS
jgi:pimeloyl-ACP methyl ester carboxylesterase